MNTLAPINIRELHELVVPTFHELKLSVDYWRGRRLEALAQVEAAWDMYSAAIDDGEPQDYIEQLSVMAEAIEAVAHDTYRELEAAKVRLLAMQN